MGNPCPPKTRGGGGGGRGGVPGQLFHGGPGHPHRINSRTIGGFAQDIGVLWEKNPPSPGQAGFSSCLLLQRGRRLEPEALKFKAGGKNNPLLLRREWAGTPLKPSETLWTLLGKTLPGLFWDSGLKPSPWQPLVTEDDLCK